jgi:hypothetical protein
VLKIGYERYRLACPASYGLGSFAGPLPRLSYRPQYCAACTTAPPALPRLAARAIRFDSFFFQNE